jgi:hypothetical protein
MSKLTNGLISKLKNLRSNKMAKEKGKILLVRCDSNWADEFDIQGFALYTEHAWKEYLRLIKIKTFSKERDPCDEYGPHVACIGTNQSLGYENFSSYKNDFKTQVVSEDEIKILQSLFALKVNEDGKEEPKAFGMFMYLDPDYEENN